MFTNWLNYSKKVKTVFKMKRDQVSTPEIVDSTNVLILVDRKVTTEDIFEGLKISMSTAHKIVHF